MKSKFPAEMMACEPSPNLMTWVAMWERSLQASNKAGDTIRNYTVSLGLLGRYCTWKREALDITAATRATLEGFLILTAQDHSPYTIETYYRAMKQFFKWLLEEEEIAAHPMARMKKPKLPESGRDVVREEHIIKLLKSCEGNEFKPRRDMAIIRLFLDTGLRLAELAGVQLDHLHMDSRDIRIFGKGGAYRDVPFGKKTAVAIDRYLRKRLAHRCADSDFLWVGRTGDRIGHQTIYDMITRKAAALGLPHVHPHLFRHTFAHLWLGGGGQEGDLRSIGGWKSDVMRRYGKKQAGDRAREAHKTHSPGDKF